MNMFLSYLEQTLHVTTFTTATTLLVLILSILYLILKDRSLPPGPIGLPLIGYWPFLKDEAVHLQLHELTKKYGDVYSFRVGGKLFILLGSIKAIKEAHITKSDSFANRYTGYSCLSICFGRGIVTRNGEEWNVIRNFFNQAFEEYGITSVKDCMSGPIYDSVNATVATLKETNGSEVDIFPILSSRSSAIFRRVVFNDNGITDKEIQEILNANANLVYIFNGKNFFLIGDFARKYLFPRIEHFEVYLESVKLMEGYFKKIIRRHEETFDRNNIRNIIDRYIKERKDRDEKGDPIARYFSEDSLIGTLIGFASDGISSIAMFIAYFIYVLLENPEQQEKIYKELIDVVGTDRGVTLEDRDNLPYTNAFMMEMMRKTDFVTYLPSLECTKETTLNGYKIPVGAITVTNFWSSHHDPLVFDEPEAFKPSRYMPVEGKLKTEPPILFGVGKRSCTGEPFVMMQVFLFLTTIVKNFRLESPKGEVPKFFVDGKMTVCTHPRGNK